MTCPLHPLCCQQSEEAAALHESAISQLNSLGSPFVLVQPSGASSSSTVPEPRFAADGAAAAEWLHGPVFTFALSLLQAAVALPAVDGMLAAQEDTQLELRCQQAMAAVRAAQGSIAVDAQVLSACLYDSVRTMHAL